MPHANSAFDEEPATCVATEIRICSCLTYSVLPVNYLVVSLRLSVSTTADGGFVIRLPGPTEWVP